MISVREQICSALRRDVIAGRLESAALREEVLASRFRVSRGPIRDALLELTKEGLLVARPNCGVRLGPPAAPAVRKLLVDLRRRIERFALQQAWKMITPAGIERFDVNLHQFRAACRKNDLPRVVELDMAFHRLIVTLPEQGLENQWLPIMGRMILPYSRHHKLLESYDEHRGIIDAIQKNDRQEALKRLMDNIQ